MLLISTHEERNVVFVTHKYALHNFGREGSHLMFLELVVLFTLALGCPNYGTYSTLRTRALVGHYSQITSKMQMLAACPRCAPSASDSLSQCGRCMASTTRKVSLR